MINSQKQFSLSTVTTSKSDQQIPSLNLTKKYITKMTNNNDQNMTNRHGQTDKQGRRNKRTNMANTHVRIASNITAVAQRDLALFCEQQILRKARCILTKKDHILNQEFTNLPSGRLRCPICKTNRFKNSFMPFAVRLLNNT